MKKLFAAFAAFIISFSINAAEYKEGTDYKVLSLPHSASPEVTEFFSFYCPHCYHFEPIAEKLAAQLPEGTHFIRNHVSFLGGNMAHSMSKAYATMISLGVEDKMIPVMFDQIHKLNQPPRDDAALKKIFTDHGIDGQAFDDAFNSFAVDSMVRRFDKSLEDSGITGVPAVVVNNKYFVQFTKGMTAEKLYKLVDYLLKK